MVFSSSRGDSTGAGAWNAAPAVMVHAAATSAAVPIHFIERRTSFPRRPIMSGRRVRAVEPDRLETRYEQMHDEQRDQVRGRRDTENQRVAPGGLEHVAGD